MGNACKGVDKDIKRPQVVAAPITAWSDTGPILHFDETSEDVQLFYPSDPTLVTLRDLLNNKQNQERLFASRLSLCADACSGCVPDPPANTLAGVLIDVAKCKFTFAEKTTLLPDVALWGEGIKDEAIINMEAMVKTAKSTHAMDVWCLKPAGITTWVSQSPMRCDAGSSNVLLPSARPFLCACG